MNKIGFIGLGKIGSRLARRLSYHFKVYAFDKDKKACEKARKSGICICKSIEEIAQRCSKKKKILLSLPRGKIIDKVIHVLLPQLSAGDIIADLGNSYYKDSIRRARTLKKKGIFYLDVGTSGGLEGAEKGVSLMIGGNKSAYKQMIPIFKKIAAKDGFDYFGQSGAGHYIKMVHNAIEYGELQAIGEGIELLAKSPYNLNLEKVARIWKTGTIIRGYLIELLHEIFKKDPQLKSASSIIGGGETGKWALDEARKIGVEMPAINAAYKARINSRASRKKAKKPEERIAAKVVAALREKFGGHIPPKN